MVDFKATQTTDGTVTFTVTAKATADTYAFQLPGSHPAAQGLGAAHDAPRADGQRGVGAAAALSAPS